MKFLTGALMTSAALIAAPALAVDAYTVFDASNGTGGFYYGSAVGTTLTDFDVSGSGGACFLTNPPTAMCLMSSVYGPIPGVSKGGTYPTVDYAGATLALHPLATGNAVADTFASFQATNAGNYSYSLTLQSIGTDTTNSVGYTLFTGAAFGTRTLLAGYPGAPVTLTNTVFLNAGERFGVVIDANGDYGGDTTALTFGVTAVPEPAQWALMIGGFGLVGGALRRRRTLVAA